MTHRALPLLALALSATQSLTAESLAAAPRYNMVLNAANAEHGVKTVSFVQNPAIQKGFVALAAVSAGPKQQLHLGAEGSYKQVLTGPALLPGQEIVRLDEQGNPYFIVFDAATIEGTARLFAQQGHHNSTNQGHAVGLSGNVMYESWIVADPAKDKAAALGLDVPAGTWMLSAHIPDADYWQKEVVSGNVTGFSIEGLFDSAQLTLSAAAPAPTPVKKNWFTALMATLLSLGADKAAEVRVALGLEQLADGRAVMIDDTTGTVTLATADGTPGEALPDGTYPLEAGGELIVEGGVRKAGETPPPTPVDAAKAPEAPAAPAAPSADAAAPAPLPETAGLPDIVKAINALIESGKKPDAQPANPATAPAAPKMAAQLKGVKLEAVGEKMEELKLDGIDLEGGDKLTYNPLTRRLSDSKGALVESGSYACADGSFFQVDTDQYIWEISANSYASTLKLAAVEAEVVRLNATKPAAARVHLSGENAAAADKPVARHLAFLASHQAQAAA